MLEVGRVCVKIAGREAGKKCTIVGKVDDNFVLIGGETKRKKCNINHLEPVDLILKVKKDADNEEIVDALNKAGIKTEKRKVKNVKEEKVIPKKSKK